MQLILAIARATNFHLASVKFSFADNAKTLVVERGPGSKSIFGAQDREAIVEFEMRVHNAKAFWPSHRNAQSGRWMIV